MIKHLIVKFPVQSTYLPQILSRISNPYLVLRDHCVVWNSWPCTDHCIFRNGTIIAYFYSSSNNCIVFNDAVLQVGVRTYKNVVSYSCLMITRINLNIVLYISFLTYSNGRTLLSLYNYSIKNLRIITESHFTYQHGIGSLEHIFCLRILRKRLKLSQVRLLLLYRE